MNVRKYLSLFIAAFILILMAVANPGENSFKKFVKEQLAKRKFSEKDIENSLIYIRSSNYFLFSEYNIQINDSGVPTESKYLGVFGGFFSVNNTTINDSQ